MHFLSFIFILTSSTSVFVFPHPRQPTSPPSTPCPTLPPLPLHPSRCNCSWSKLDCDGEFPDEVALLKPCARRATIWSVRGTNARDLRFIPEPCHLQMLDVSHNRIASFDGSLGQCHGLSMLDVSHNPIGIVPGRVFEKMVRLGYLYLQFSKLRYVDEEAFVGLHMLASLKLSYNLLTHVPQNAFRELLNIDVIDLSYNRLLILPESLFHRTSNLRFLLLNGNHLAFLQSGLFKGLRVLHYLNVANNQIPFLSSDIFHGLIYLRRLDAQQNVLQEIPVLQNCCLIMNHVDLRWNRITSPKIDAVRTMLRLGEPSFGAMNVDMDGNPVTRAALCRLLHAGGTYTDACHPWSSAEGCMRGRLGHCRPAGGCYWLRIHEEQCERGGGEGAPESDWRWDYDYDDRK